MRLTIQTTIHFWELLEEITMKIHYAHSEWNFMGRIVLARVLFVIIVPLALAALSQELAAADFYVSLSGSDVNPGTITQPFRTIQRAADVLSAGDTCFVRAGTYRETVTLSRSGTSAAPITIMAYPGETVVVSGADAVGGWSLYSNGIFMASAPWTLGRGKDQLFIDGNVVKEAHFPNYPSGAGAFPVTDLGPLWPVYGDFRVPQGTTSSVTSGLLTQPAGFWTGAIYVGSHWNDWSAQTADVTGSGSGFLGIANPTTEWWFNGPGPWDATDVRGRGAIIGGLNALDMAGEWARQGNTVYFWPPAGDNPNNHLVEVKRRHLAFDLSNRSYIHIKDLQILAASIRMEASSYCLLQNLRMRYISHFTRFASGRDGYIETGSFSDRSPQKGEVGLYMGGHNNVLRDSVIQDSAGAGVFMTGYDHIVTNNWIRDCDYSGTYLAPIFVSYDPTERAGDLRGGHEISFNTLQNAGRSLLIFQSNNIGYWYPTHYKKNMIINNHMFNSSLIARDSGLIYAWEVAGGTPTELSEIAQNVIHDEWEAGNAGWVVYMDNNTYNFAIHNNILWLGREGGSRSCVFLNPPNGNIPVWNNTCKSAYTGGVAGLTDSDFPGGVRFAFGHNFAHLNVTDLHGID